VAQRTATQHVSAAGSCRHSVLSGWLVMESSPAAQRMLASTAVRRPRSLSGHQPLLLREIQSRLAPLQAGRLVAAASGSLALARPWLVRAPGEGIR